MNLLWAIRKRCDKDAMEYRRTWLCSIDDLELEERTPPRNASKVELCYHFVTKFRLEARDKRRFGKDVVLWNTRLFIKQRKLCRCHWKSFFFSFDRFTREKKKTRNEEHHFVAFTTFVFSFGWKSNWVNFILTLFRCQFRSEREEGEKVSHNKSISFSMFFYFSPFVQISICFTFDNPNNIDSWVDDARLLRMLRAFFSE